MPVSDSYGKDWIQDRIRAHNDVRPIRRVLDVGPGCGTYSDLLRPVLPSAAFSAVEVYEPYIGKYELLSKYDCVMVCDIRSVPARIIRDYDLVIFGDVLEHMPKADACELLWNCSYPSIIVVSIPMGVRPQGAVGGNKHEEHVASWEFDEMANTLQLMVHGVAGKTYTNLETCPGDVVSCYVLD
jgi:hypothetical protein